MKHVLFLFLSRYGLFLAAGAVLRVLLRDMARPWRLPVVLLIAGGIGWLCAVGGNWMALAVGMAALCAAIGAAVCGIVLRILARNKS